MIKPPSVQNDYTVIFSGDPSLNLPEDTEQRAAALKLAAETGQWQTLLRDGAEPPTMFTLRPLSGTVYGWWAGEVGRRSMSNLEAACLLVRLALTSVAGFGPFKVQHVKADGHRIATTEIIDALYAQTGTTAIDELAEIINSRAQVPIRPLS